MPDNDSMCDKLTRHNVCVDEPTILRRFPGYAEGRLVSVILLLKRIPTGVLYVAIAPATSKPEDVVKSPDRTCYTHKNVRDQGYTLTSDLKRNEAVFGWMDEDRRRSPSASECKDLPENTKVVLSMPCRARPTAQQQGSGDS